MPGKVKLFFDKDDPLSKSRTQQHFAKDVDINNIMRKYMKTGVLGDPFSPPPPGYFADVSTVGDFIEVSNKIKLGEQLYSMLPLELKEKFKTIPEVLAFIADPKNEDEARRYGLLKPLTPEEAAAKAAAVKAAEAAKVPPAA